MVETRVQPEKTGTIKIFNGLVSNIAPGWQLCDGTNGTPDLRGKFVKGAQSGDEGGSGGSTSYTHSGAAVAAHAAQAHSQPAQTSLKAGTSASTVAPLAHTHPDHPSLSHSVTQPNDHTDVEPPYYKLCFIMKL